MQTPSTSIRLRSPTACGRERHSIQRRKNCASRSRRGLEAAWGLNADCKLLSATSIDDERYRVGDYDLTNYLAPHLATTSGALPSYVGVWARSGSHCQAEGDTVPMEIEVSSILFYESRCDLEAIVQHGESWTAQAACSGEGETWNESIRMTVLVDSRSFFQK